METILKIEEIENEEHEGIYTTNKMSGYAIETDKQVVKMMIDNDHQCSEHFGYFMSEDDFSKFIGSKLLDISVTDTALNTNKFESVGFKETPPYVYEGGIMFVNIHTSNGVLQFVAYNEHNGYYGHEAMVISQQINHEECL